MYIIISIVVDTSSSKYVPSSLLLTLNTHRICNIYICREESYVAIGDNNFHSLEDINYIIQTCYSSGSNT